MTLSHAVLDAMVEAGCTTAQIVAVVKAALAHDLCHGLRSPNAVRQARYRARKRLLRSGIAQTLAMPDAQTLPQGTGAPSAILPIDANALAADPATLGVTRYVTSVTPVTAVTPDPAKKAAAEASGVGSAHSATSPAGPNKAVARRALVLAGLPASVVKVGSALIDHFNLQTGRCDPSMARIAALCGLSMRTVRRATARLDATGLITRRRHGGRAHCNAFAPDWSRLWQVVTSFDGQPLTRPQTVTRNATRTVLAANPDKNVHQTPLKNPDTDISRGESRRTQADASRARQMAMLLPIPGGRGSTEQALEAAKSRWFRDFDRRHKGSAGYPVLLEALARLDLEATERIDRAELTHPGSGADQAHREIAAAQGPPAAREGPAAQDPPIDRQAPAAARGHPTGRGPPRARHG